MRYDNRFCALLALGCMAFPGGNLVTPVGWVFRHFRDLGKDGAAKPGVSALEHG